MNHPAYGTAGPAPEPGAPPALDPVKAHAAVCAAVVLAGAGQRVVVNKYDIETMSKGFEEFLRKTR